MAYEIKPLEWHDDEDRPGVIRSTSLEDWGNELATVEIRVYDSGSSYLDFGRTEFDDPFDSVELAKAKANELHAQSLMRWLRPA